MIRNAINAISFFIQLGWLKHKREKTSRSISNAQKRAVDEKTREDIWHERHWEIEVAQHAVQALQTQYYRQVANRKGIPTPKGETDWEENINHIGSRIMTVEAIAKFRSAIRQEKKELRDVWLPYLALGFSAIALILSYLSYRKPSHTIIQIQQQSPLPTPTPTPKQSHKAGP